MGWTDCPSVSFDCPQRERGQVYISGREDERVGLLSGPLSADPPFGRLRHQTTIGRGTGGVTDTLLVLSVDKYNRQTDWVD